MKKVLLTLAMVLALTSTLSNDAKAQESTFKIQIVDMYDEVIKEAKATEKVTIVMVTESWCQPCNMLKAKIAKVPNILLAKIGLKHPQVSKLNAYYKSKGLSPISGIPDWVVIKYKDGKLVHISRYRGSCSTQELLDRLRKASTTNNVSPQSKVK